MHDLDKLETCEMTFKENDDQCYFAHELLYITKRPKFLFQKLNVKSSQIFYLLRVKGSRNKGKEFRVPRKIAKGKRKKCPVEF